MEVQGRPCRCCTLYSVQGRTCQDVTFIRERTPAGWVSPSGVPPQPKITLDHLIAHPPIKTGFSDRQVQPLCLFQFHFTFFLSTTCDISYSSSSLTTFSDSSWEDSTACLQAEMGLDRQCCNRPFPSSVSHPTPLPPQPTHAPQVAPATTHS